MEHELTRYQTGEELLGRVADPFHLLSAFTHISRRRKFRPGVDGETREEFAAQLDRNIGELSRVLLMGEYRFSPSIEYQIPTAGGEYKTISRATLRDTIVQKALSLVVEPAFDNILAENCYAFRPRGGPQIGDALRRVLEHERRGSYWKIKSDIRDYFQNIKHPTLTAQLHEILPASVLHLYLSYLHAPRLTEGQTKTLNQGLPVGSILANFLSNLYLLPLDRALLQTGVTSLRYCDDLLAFARSSQEAQELQEIIVSHITTLGLELNHEKSRIIPPSDPFTHLGYLFHNGKISIGPRALAKFKARMRRATPRNKRTRLTAQSSQQEVGKNALRQIIAQVNKEIRVETAHNWVRYFAYCDLPDQLRELDHWIRDRVRAAATGSWNRSNYRLLPTLLLRDFGLHTLVGEYYAWRHHHTRKSKSLIRAIAQRGHLQETLEHLRKKYWDSRRARYDFSPGADGQAMEEFLAESRRHLTQIQKDLLAASYQFTPFIEFDKVKMGRGDRRIICRASFRDTLVQRAVSHHVQRHFDRLLNPRALAYRPGRNQHAAFGLVLRWIRRWPDYWVVKGDFRSFLDTVDLGLMADALRQLLVHEPLLLDFYLKYLYNSRIRNGIFLPRQRGLPRGGVLTPFLANLYLKPLDEALSSLVPTLVGTISSESGYLRYADDLFVFCPTRQEAEVALALLREMAGKLKLELSPDKTGIIPPGEEYECLGYRVQGREVRVRPNALRRLQDRIRRLTSRRRPRLNPQSLQDPAGQEMMRRLVARVRRAYIYSAENDWPRYFCRASSDQQLRELDRWIADRVRACATGRWSRRSRRLLPDTTLRQLGLVSLVSRFWYWKRRVWKQSQRKRLVRL